MKTHEWGEHDARHMLVFEEHEDGAVTITHSVEGSTSATISIPRKEMDWLAEQMQSHRWELGKRELSSAWNDFKKTLQDLGK